MTERAADLQVVQFGVESTPGTAVAANRRLGCVTGFSGGPKPSVRHITPAGQKYPVATVPTREFSQYAFSGDQSYGDMIFFLSSLFKTLSPTGPNADGAYTYAYGVDRITQETPKSLSVEYGDAVRAEKFNYGLVTGMTFEVTQEAATFEGTILGRQWSDGITLTASPTEPQFVPIGPNDWKLYLDSTAAGIGTTQLTRSFMARWGLGDHWAQVFGLNAAADPVGHVERDPTFSVDLTLEKDSTGMALMTALRGGSTRYLRLEATGATIAGTSKYKATWDFAVKLDTPDDDGEDEGASTMVFHFVPAYDSTLAKAFSGTFINTITSVA